MKKRKGLNSIELLIITAVLAVLVLVVAAGVNNKQDDKTTHNDAYVSDGVISYGIYDENLTDIRFNVVCLENYKFVVAVNFGKPGFVQMLDTKGNGILCHDQNSID